MQVEQDANGRDNPGISEVQLAPGVPQRMMPNGLMGRVFGWSPDGPWTPSTDTLTRLLSAGCESGGTMRSLKSDLARGRLLRCSRPGQPGICYRRRSFKADG